MRMELAPHGIDVIIVEPGGTATDWGIAADNPIKTSKGGAYEVTATKQAEVRKKCTAAVNPQSQPHLKNNWKKQ
ncbi:MAG: hypothetical protein R2883_00390 [Caldisericia bacterium]